MVHATSLLLTLKASATDRVSASAWSSGACILGNETVWVHHASAARLRCRSLPALSNASASGGS